MANYKGYLKDKDGNSIVPSQAEKLVVEDVVCKNIIPVLTTTRTISGVTFTINKDKSITITGTAPADTDADLYLVNAWASTSVFTTLNGTYTLSLGISNPSIILYLVNGSTVVCNTTSKTTQTFTNREITCAFIRVCRGSTINVTVYPQLEEGTQVTNYVEHKEFNNKQIYSTNEQVIGTWIDGKPLYRKVVPIVLSDVTDDTIVNIRVNHNIQNMKYGWVELATRLLSNNSDIYTYGSSGYINAADRRIQWFLNTEQLSASMNRSVDNGTWYVSLCYTKTTD